MENNKSEVEELGNNVVKGEDELENIVENTDEEMYDENDIDEFDEDTDEVEEVEETGVPKKKPGDEGYIIAKYPSKPGFDDADGKYRVLGAVTVKHVFRRKKVGTNITPTIGYHIEEIETGRRLMVEKSQGVRICAESGMRNAYIVYRSKTRKGANGEVLKTTPTVYLHPNPARTESFTQDDRIVTVFKMNSEGVIIKPMELTVTEEQCTPELWRLIMKEYNVGNRRAKRSRRGEEERHRQLLENLKSELKKQDHITNPFNV